MARKPRFGVVASLTLAFAVLSPAPSPAAGGLALSFGGTRSGTTDIVRVAVDDPATHAPGPPVDVGAEPFTIELWLRGSRDGAVDEPIECGPNDDWMLGNVIVDRERVNEGRSFGVGVAGGTLVFGVTSASESKRTVCGTRDVLDGDWHHVAVEFRPSDGAMWIFTDGALDARGNGPAGDLSYPDDGVPSLACNGQPCTNDPYLAIGAAKRREHPSFRGSIDEVRVSSVLRYTSAFARPSAAFVRDGDTAALYHLDEGAGSSVLDSSQALGGPSNGERLTDASGRPTYSDATPFAGAATGNGGSGSGGGSTTPPRNDGGGPATNVTRPRSVATQPSRSASGDAAPHAIGGTAADTREEATRRLAGPMPFEDQPVIPPVAVALLGLGIAIAVAAHLLRGEPKERL